MYTYSRDIRVFRTLRLRLVVLRNATRERERLFVNPSRNSATIVVLKPTRRSAVRDCVVSVSELNSALWRRRRRPRCYDEVVEFTICSRSTTTKTPSTARLICCYSSLYMCPTSSLDAGIELGKCAAIHICSAVRLGFAHAMDAFMLVGLLDCVIKLIITLRAL